MTNPVTATTCPECEGRLRAEGDETVCGACGLVVAEDRLDRGPVVLRSPALRQVRRERFGQHALDEG